MSKSLISVIITGFDDVACLKRCLESVGDGTLCTSAQGRGSGHWEWNRVIPAKHFINPFGIVSFP